MMLCILLLKDAQGQSPAPCNQYQIPDKPTVGYCLESCQSPIFTNCDSTTLSGQGPFCVLNNGGNYRTKYSNLCQECKNGQVGFYYGICPGDTCTSNSDCPSTTPICDPTTHKCRPSNCLDPGYPCDVGDYCDTSSVPPVCRPNVCTNCPQP